MPGRWRGRGGFNAGQVARQEGFYARRGRHQAASPTGPCYTCYMCYMGLTRQATEHPLSPGSLLYVLYVLYGSHKASH